MSSLDDARRWLREALAELERNRFDEKIDFESARESTERALEALRKLAPGPRPSW